MARIGLLEDNPRIARLCVTMLHYAGHHVILYQHSLECLLSLLPETAASAEPLPLPIDLLILDLYIPGMAGVEVLQLLRSHPLTSQLPVVLCTAASPREIAHAQSVAPEAIVVEKPFKLQTLISAISTLLRSPAAVAERPQRDEA